MRARVLGLVLALVAFALTAVGVGVATSPATASGCYSTTRTTSHEDVWDDITVHFDDVYRARLYLRVCRGSYDLDGYRLSVHKYGSVNCGAGDVRGYRMNVTPLAGVDPAPHTWTCSAGQSSYSYWVPVHKTVPRSLLDPCFNFTWRRIMLFRDVSGNSHTVCLP